MVIGLITARAGSKGFPGKNYSLLKGKPLIVWSIEAAINSQCFDRVYVSTDCEKVKAICQSFNLTVIDRPAILASDTASSHSVIKHAIEYLDLPDQTQIMLLQPTSPLRTSIHIRESLQQFWDTDNCNCIVSVYEPSHPPTKAYILSETGKLEGLLSPEAPYLRRQDLPPSFQPNGAIYIFTVKAFKLDNKIPQQNVFPYIMPEALSIDIDNPRDINLAEHQLSY